MSVIGTGFGVVVLATWLVAVTIVLVVSWRLPSSPPLADAHQLVGHVQSVLRFVGGAGIIGLSAAVAVAAQSDWDATASRGQPAQIHAVLSDAVGTPLAVAAVFGVALLGPRVGFGLWRSGRDARERARPAASVRRLG